MFVLRGVKRKVKTRTYHLMQTPFLLTFTYDSCGEKIIGKYVTNKNISIGRNYPVPITHDTTVEINQCILNYRDRTCFLHDTSSAGTFTRISHTKSTQIPYGVYIVCGRTFIFPVNSHEVLVIDEKFNVISSFAPIYNYEYIVGKGKQKENIVNQADNCLSNSHCKILFQDNSIRVIDWKNGKGSLNGTFVSLMNDTIIESECQLRIGNETFLTITPLADKDKSMCRWISMVETTLCKEFINASNSSSEINEDNPLIISTHIRMHHPLK